MNEFPTPAQARSYDKSTKEEASTVFVRRSLIALALKGRGKAFVFSQGNFRTTSTETILLAEIESKGWTYDLIADHTDGGYYLIKPAS